MTLTPEHKAHIDGMGYEHLLRRWRTAPAGDPWFEGATGDYWRDRMKALRAAPGGEAIHAAASKSIGWGS